MWIEDTESIKAKLDLINRYEIQLGQSFKLVKIEDNSVWRVYQQKLFKVIVYKNHLNIILLGDFL